LSLSLCRGVAAVIPAAKNQKPEKRTYFIGEQQGVRTGVGSINSHRVRFGS
jgi:hypothetical protein